MNTRLMVRIALGRGVWLAPYDIQRIIEIKYDTRMSDSSITARMRDLRKAKYGGHVIDCRKRPGAKVYEYRLQPPTPQTELNL